jgi:hypothetical protein
MLAAILVFFYGLSIGPAEVLRLRGTISDSAFGGVYWPLIWAMQTLDMGGLLNQYLNVWTHEYD